jgi:hypothetical protein
MAYAAFRNGDLVFLAKGTYAGTRGTFLSLRADTHWADTKQEDGVTREYPVDCMAFRHAGQAYDFHPEIATC